MKNIARYLKLFLAAFAFLYFVAVVSDWEAHKKAFWIGYNDASTTINEPETN